MAFEIEINNAILERETEKNTIKLNHQISWHRVSTSPSPSEESTRSQFAIYTASDYETSRRRSRRRKQESEGEGERKTIEPGRSTSNDAFKRSTNIYFHKFEITLTSNLLLKIYVWIVLCIASVICNLPHRRRKKYIYLFAAHLFVRLCTFVRTHTHVHVALCDSSSSSSPHNQHRDRSEHNLGREKKHSAHRVGLLENIQRNKSYLQRSNRGRTFIISLASATTIFNWHSPFGFCPRERKKNTNIIIYWQSLADTGGNSGGRHKLTQDIASALAKTAHTTQVNWTFNILIVFHLFLPLGARIFSHSKMYRYSLSSVYAIAKQVKLQANFMTATAAVATSCVRLLRSLVVVVLFSHTLYTCALCLAFSNWFFCLIFFRYCLPTSNSTGKLIAECIPNTQSRHREREREWEEEME